MPKKERTYKILDFDKVLSIVSGYAQSTETKKLLLTMQPSFDVTSARNAQSLVAEAMLVRGKYLLSPIMQIDEIDEICAKNRIGITLTMGELLRISRVLKAAAYLKEKIMSTGEDIVLLKNHVSTLFIDKTLQKNIEDSILSDSEMSDNASAKLRSIRRNILNLNARLKEKLNSYTKNNSSSEFLQDNLYTVRNNRYVLPVKSECRGSVPGLIHDQSASGSTVFIEPFQLVELNNDLQTAFAEEQAEIERILKDFSARVYSRLDDIAACKEKIIMSDIVFSKAIFGEKYACFTPFLTTDGIISLKNARHPLIDKNKVVPISIDIGDKYNILLITGPNTGGKTVCMKTVGLFCLMAYSGIPLPCEEASISVFDEIFCDIGDEQSITNELSTFSSHVVNINAIVSDVNANSLVLLDELGGGTDPTEGAALAIGIIKYLELVGSKAIISTHYDKLKEYALTSKKLMNACMLFDEETLLPTYRLVVGMPGSSNAIKIAKGLGMNAFILTEAEKNLDTQKIHYENIIRSAEKIKNQAEQEKMIAEQEKEAVLRQKALLEAEKNKTEALYAKIKSNASAEVKRIVSARVEKAESIIDEMKSLISSANEKSLLEARKKRNQLVDLEFEINSDELPEYVDLPDSMLKEGQIVMVKSLGLEAVIVRLQNKKGDVRVKVGNVTTEVKRSDLALAQKKEAVKPKKSAASHARQNTPREAPSGIVQEIMVIGQTVAEAIETVEPYIIAAHGSLDKQLRIVHGKGTMALARGLQDYLKKMPLVDSFRFGRYGEGDNGVTIVLVK